MVKHSSTTEVGNRRSSLGFGKFSFALRFYRLMAFVTGIVLLIGTIGLILQQIPSTGVSVAVIGPLWVAHGYLFVVYVLATVNLGLHLRWHTVRILFTAAAGTIPTMSFVAERLVVHRLASALVGDDQL